MTDISDVAPAPQLPPTAGANLASSIKAGLFLFAGTLATNGAQWLQGHGLISSDQTAQVVSIGSGIIISGATLAYSFLQNKAKARKLIAAAATGNPSAAVDAPETSVAIKAAIADPNSPIVAKS